MTGLWVLLFAVVLVFGFGTYRRVAGGRTRAVAAGAGSLDAGRLGSELGAEATLVQFSTQVCAECRTTTRLLAGLAASHPAVRLVEIDAENRPDLVREFGIRRAPTVLLLDSKGALRHRVVGLAKPTDLLAALEQVCRSRAA